MVNDITWRVTLRSGVKSNFYMLDWGGGTTDAQSVMDPILHSPEQRTQKGADNMARFQDAELDRLIDAAGIEMNVQRRSAFIIDALRRTQRQFYYLPPHRQMLTWASRANVRPVVMPDNVVRVHLDPGRLSGRTATRARFDALAGPPAATASPAACDPMPAPLQGRARAHCADHLATHGHQRVVLTQPHNPCELQLPDSSQYVRVLEPPPLRDAPLPHADRLKIGAPPSKPPTPWALTQ